MSAASSRSRARCCAASRPPSSRRSCARSSRTTPRSCAPRASRSSKAQSGERAFHALVVRARPVHPVAADAVRECRVQLEHSRRNAARHLLLSYGFQRQVAMQAQRERPRTRSEPVARGNLAELRLGLWRAHVAAALDLAAFEEIAVARQDDAAFVLRDAANLAIAERLVVDRIE